MYRSLARLSADTNICLDTVSLKNPIYVREESKQLVKEAVWNDSQFLSDLSEPQTYFLAVLTQSPDFQTSLQM